MKYATHTHGYQERDVSYGELPEPELLGRHCLARSSARVEEALHSGRLLVLRVVVPDGAMTEGTRLLDALVGARVAAGWTLAAATASSAHLTRADGPWPGADNKG
jgi:hypothetical protein